MSDVPERLRAALADRYRIERELGEGGMATVYLSEDLKHESLRRSPVRRGASGGLSRVRGPGAETGVVTRAQFEHAIRAAGGVPDVDEVILIGSQALHASMATDLSVEATRSIVSRCHDR